jgi:hypothetical protein
MRIILSDLAGNLCSIISTFNSEKLDIVSIKTKSKDEETKNFCS